MTCVDGTADDPLHRTRDRHTRVKLSTREPAAYLNCKELNMANRPLTVLVVGATGSIGRLVVDEAIARGHTVRALVRDHAKGVRLLPADTNSSPAM